MKSWLRSTYRQLLSFDSGIFFMNTTKAACIILLISKIKLTAMQKLNQRLVFFRVLPALLTFFFSLMMLVVQAQQRQISGTVTDGKGSPVASATVAVKGSKTSTLTADNGSFTIAAKDGDVLVFSAISFETTEVKITSESTYSVTMNATT